MLRKIILIAITTIVPLLGKSQTEPISSESRYAHEFVFPDGMRNMSVGASPVIVKSCLPRLSDGAGMVMTMPPIQIGWERCFIDLGLGGSFGWGVSLSHGRYKYTVDGPDGRGGNTVTTRVGMTQGMAGLSYHYTIRTRLEAYTRLMFGAVVGGYKSDREGATHSMEARMILSGVVGARWFFSNSWGAYLEGGYTMGAANLGVTYRW